MKEESSIPQLKKSQVKPQDDPVQKIELNPIDAKIGNIFLKYLSMEHSNITYPFRMKKMIMLFNKEYKGITTIKKAKFLVIESMLRHVHSHGKKRFNKFKKELDNYMSGDNILYAPVGTELQFIPADWNDLWIQTADDNAPDLEY